MSRAGTLIFILFALGHTNGFTIYPLSAPVTQHEPFTISWAREHDDPWQWHLNKQNMNRVTDPAHDFTLDVSEDLTAANPHDFSGEMTIQFTVSAGSFRLLAFDDRPFQTATTPFFTSDPTITAVLPVPSSTGDENSQNESGDSPFPTSTSTSPSFTTPFIPSITSPPSSTDSLSPEESSSSQTNDSRSPKVPIIVGGVLGGIIFFLLLFILAWVMRNRRRRERAARSVIFYRDKMVRQRDLENWELPEPEGKLEDSKVFRFDSYRKGVSTGVGNSNSEASVAHRVSPISSYSIGDSLKISPLKSPSAHSL